MTTGAHLPNSPPPDLLAEIDAVLISRGLPSGCASNAVVDGCWLQLQLLGVRTTWTVKVELESSYFAKLPRIMLVSPVRLLAHVSHDQLICIDDGQGLSIDTLRPTTVLANVVADALAVLDESDADVDLLGLFDELEGYWDGLPNRQSARSAVEVEGGSRILYGHVENLGKGKLTCWYLTERSGSRPTEFHTAELANFTALYFSLTTMVEPPPPGGILDKSFIDRVISALSVADRKLWDDTLFKRWKGQRRICPVLISMPRPAGGSSFIGLTFTLRNGKIDTTNSIKPLAIRRHTVGYMRERGGASVNLAGNHVAVIGCGSVGSEVADTLAACGVGKLTLVDTDTLEVENVFRHSLGKHAIGQDKPNALKFELLRKYPGIQIEAAVRAGHVWLASEPAKQVDAVVVAIGNPAGDRSLARQIQSQGLKCSTTVTWLEAFGLGGHVVSISPKSTGCIDCVYRDDEGNDSLHPYVSFLAPGQKVSRSISGCLGTYIPYSALHSRQTALLAANAVIRKLQGADEPNYLYWTGCDSQANEQGIRTSPWYSRAKTVDPKLASKTVFDEACRHCASQRA